MHWRWGAAAEMEVDRSVSEEVGGTVGGDLVRRDMVVGDLGGGVVGREVRTG